MLRVGLTGDLGSGKSTVAKLLAGHGAIVLSSDEMGRALMRPGQRVYAAIVERFGPDVVATDGTLDRRKLALLAFDPASSRVEELNNLIHPAVLQMQQEIVAQIAHSQPDAIAVIESALIFTTHAAGEAGWPSRFDRILLVTAPEEQKVARFVARNAAGREITPAVRTALEADARARLALQHTEAHAAECLVLRNEGSPEDLRREVEVVWSELKRLAAAS